jgi:uncharacterized membrane protein
MAEQTRRKRLEMATLSVLRFSSPGSAENTIDAVRDLARQGSLNVKDVATVRWARGAGLPETRQIRGVVDVPAMGEAFWTMLFSLIFFIPRAAREAGSSRPIGDCSLAELGISDDFVWRIRERVSEGTSGLFLLTSDATVDRVASLFGELQFTLMSTNLSTREMEALRCGFPPAGGEAIAPVTDGRTSETLPFADHRHWNTQRKGDVQ